MQDLHEPISIPETFLDAHYSQSHLMAALQIGEPEFWGMYVTGKIPRGYSLMALTGVPIVVWPKRILDQWNANGRPAEPGAAELENEILHSLMTACEAEGITFPTHAPYGISEGDLN
jgi:hypothetical protein